MFNTNLSNKKRVKWPAAILFCEKVVKVELLAISVEGAIIESPINFNNNQRIKFISKAIINGKQVNIICFAYVRYTVLCRMVYKTEIEFELLDDHVKAFLSFLA